jgi:hypothetical protein
MRRMIWGLLLALFAAVPNASALRLEDTTVVIPVIGRFAGAPPSIWRTDLFIANPYSPVAVVTANFYVTGGTMQQRTFTIQPFSTISLLDVVLNSFGMTTAAGELELICPTSIEARARIFNAGSSVGEFAQAIPGIGKNQLRIESFVYGLSGINGNRCNVGVANPNDNTVSLQIEIRNVNGTTLYIRSGISLGPHQYLQYNDVFATLGITPQDNVAVYFTTADTPIYGFASIVRNDSGDPIFLFGTGPNV